MPMDSGGLFKPGKLFQAGPNIEKSKLGQMPGQMQIDGQPAINLFLNNDPNTAGVISSSERQEAADNLRAIATRRSDEFAKLGEMPFEQAKAEAARLLADVEAEDERLSNTEKAA